MKKSLYKFIKTIPGWLSQDEGNFLTEKALATEHLKGKIVEIGSFCGKSTIYLAQGKGKVYAVDPHLGFVEEGLQFDNTYKAFKTNIEKADVTEKIVPIRKTSRDAVREWKKPIRLLFIDALHDEKNALFDFTKWEKFVIEGGVIAIHDSYLRWCGSEKVAMAKLVNSRKFTKVGHTDTLIYAVKTKPSLIPSDLGVRFAMNAKVQLNHLAILLSIVFSRGKSFLTKFSFSVLVFSQDVTVL